MSTRLRFSSIEKWLMKKIHRWLGETPVRVILGKNKEEVAPTATAPVASVIVRDRRTLAKLILNPEIGFGDAYAKGLIEVEGDLAVALEAICRSMSKNHRSNPYSRLVSRWLDRAQANTLRGSRENIHKHYDLRLDFYKLWLDSQLVYTCAYFPTPSATLEEAQFAKLDLVCRKLKLQPGESVVEAGCGWGALALHMAKNYGVNVKAYNISHEQILYARRRAEEEGLSHQVEFIEDDYRNICGHFDVFMSVGMLEHVGAEHYAELGRVIDRTLDDSGRGLLHFIGRNQPRPFSAWTRKRIFPGAYAPSLRQALEILEPWDFSVLDVENLRLHYAKTLEHWLSRFEKSAGRVSEMFGGQFVRMWRLYLAGSMVSFRAGALQLFQIVFARPNCRRIPWTRAYLYAKEKLIAEHTADTLAEQEPTWIRVMS